jgi:23S rRNA (guanine2445-N2)-methyltransferase
MNKRKIIVRRRKSGRTQYQLFATTVAGLEDVLADELKALGVKQIVPSRRGVAFSGTLETVYRTNLWLRTAHRILLELAEFEAPNREALYEGVRKVHWAEHVSVDGTLAVDAVSNRSELNHTQFISRLVKDAIVDGFRERTGRRPNVERTMPDLQLNARILSDRCTLSLDTSGQRLHRRGYRPGFGLEAPLKETLAAGILLKSNYDGTQPIIDPMCGSGTFLIEAALMAKNIAPGLLGHQFGFMRHPSFDRNLWRETLDLAKAAIRHDAEISVTGADISEDALRTARAAISGAGVDDIILLRRADIADLGPRKEGLLVVNPPYGERLGEIEKLGNLYQTLGDTLKQRCTGMTAHIFTGSKYLSGRIGLRPHRRDILFNGAIECRLLHFRLY